ncbi:hypothetical protein HG535_0C01030 [Zygotorulaspora mrakii]|uniref:Uncharacterized protein n=1 Tax=Zygotorulaspora mrakii TaxID=42260 RepID=A0A7H9B087_ZYGMR|nr:uncharacterized protein HG535_0C01030 [Zygotorulaspora mrakii]QLG71754.1 hypothetical protein HG535_0C01030 [Zygotorulaspora mrakii]
MLVSPKEPGSFKVSDNKNDACSHKAYSMSQESVGNSNENCSKRVRNIRTRRPRFRFRKDMKTDGTCYNLITSIEYLNEKYGIRKTHYIEKFLKCIHKKMDQGVNRISNDYVERLDPWAKVKFFLLLIMLSQRGGPEYWMDKNDQEKDISSNVKQNQQEIKKKGSSMENNFFSLTEHIMRQNINREFTESTYDENYVFSSIWANFMEGLINHYLEQIIVPRSEMKVCQQLYKPMMKIISLYNEYNELMEKSERNGFLPSMTEDDKLEDGERETTEDDKLEDGERETTEDDKLEDGERETTEDDKLEDGERETTEANNTGDSKESDKAQNKDNVTQERLQRAQKLLWQARQDIPKTISKELTLLSEMYSTLSADEQDYELDEFVCCAEEYIELEYLPSLIDVLFENCGTMQFWKIMIVLEPFFYYIEDVGDNIGEDDEIVAEDDIGDELYDTGLASNEADLDRMDQKFKPDQRVVILEKICEVAARQKWI